MNNNQIIAVGPASPRLKCIRRRNTYPVCAFRVKTHELNDLGQLVEVLGLCRVCKRSEQKKAAAARLRQRRLAYMRQLKAANKNLNMEFDAYEFIQDDTEIERQHLESMLTKKLAEIEDLRKRKEAMVMA